MRGAPATVAPERIGAAPRVYDGVDARVIVLKLTPELQPSIFGLLKRDYDAVILETFGIGGIPPPMGMAPTRTPSLTGWAPAARSW